MINFVFVHFFPAVKIYIFMWIVNKNLFTYLFSLLAYYCTKCSIIAFVILQILESVFGAGVSHKILTLNSLPINKFSDLFTLKAFANDKINMGEKLKFVLGRVENIVGKGKNAGYQHFLLFPQCLQKLSFSGSL